MRTKNKHMKTITKFIFGFPMLALACGSIAFAQDQFAPLTPADSAAKAAAQGAAQAAAQGAAPVGAPVSQTVAFASGSRWHLTVNAVQKFGLVITGASFQKSPTSPFIYVLFDGRLGEIFVPYHPGSPRFLDISDHNFPPATLNPAHFPPPRQIIGGGKICKEVRDYLAYMNFFDANRVRYGQEVVYFSVLDAFNYAYIMEWTFRDDGAILVRAGSTGPKYPTEFKEGHMHDFTWRLDIDLNGANANSAYLTSHFENLFSNSTATDKSALISREGSRVWNPQNFNTLGIVDETLENGNGRPTSYELVPMRRGTARHSEPYTRKDFWVTRYNPEELLAVNLPDYVRDGQPTENEDLVLWYTGSEHHESDSRDEDKNTVSVLWTGFELIPNNLFDHTPFYPNP
jgi:Cu2+-containing amine oxidase